MRSVTAAADANARAIPFKPAGMPLVSSNIGWPAPVRDGSGYKVVFINPPSIPYNMVVKALANRKLPLVQTIAMPIGILYLSSVLERDLPGIEIRIVDLAKGVKAYSTDPERTEITLEDLTARLLREQVEEGFVPDFVGISILFSTAHRSTAHIADAVKQRWPSTPVIVGGMHATNAVESLLSMKDIDYVCRGEAETIISAFAGLLRSGSDPESLPGIVGRAKLAAVQASATGLTESAPLVEDLDTIPFPAWHLIPMDEYAFMDTSRARKLDTIEQDGEATIMTTRGCPFSCTFCASWTVHGRKMRYRSLDNVMAELRILHERYRITMVIPEDDLFTVKKSRILELCSAVSGEFQDRIHFQFPNGLSVATLDEDVVAAMVRMGMNLANIAIESGSEYVQKHVIKKNCNLQRARSVIQACRDNGAIVRAYFILGFPGETREQMEETIRYSATLASDWNIYNVAAPLIGTEMYEELLARGEIDQSFNWDDAFFGERVYDTPEIAAQELKDLAYAANIHNNFFGNYNLRMGHYERARQLFQDILNVYPGHLAAQYCIGLAHQKMGNDEGYRHAIEACHDMLAPERDPLARRLYASFGELFSQLEPAWPDLDMLLPPPVGPRPGLPTRARQVI